MAPFNGFSKEAIRFFDEVATHNTKAWFDANKKRYEVHILEVNRAFVEEMGEHLECLVPTINAIPKVNQSLFKIYKDTRFSTDASVIKDHTAMLFWQGKGPRMQSSAFYLHYNAHELFVGVGIRRFKPPLLATYREYIKDPIHAKALAEILHDLQAQGFMIPEPRYKRLPRGFSDANPYAWLALHDGIRVGKKMPIDDTFFQPSIIDTLFRVYETMWPLQQWVYEMTLTQENDAMLE